MEKYKIMLVDDEESVLSSLERVLRCDDYLIKMFNDPRKAVECVQEEGVNLIICDYKMPGMNGLEFFENVNKNNPEIISILLTGEVDIRMVAEAVNKLSLQGFVLKPWDNEELKRLVRDSLDGYGSRTLKILKAKDIMSRFAVTIEKNDTLLEAAHLLIRFKISGLPVVSREGKIEGIITATDLFGVMGETHETLKIPETRSTVEEVMTKEVITVDPETTFKEIIDIMCSRVIHTLPVVYDGEIVGIIGRRDVFYRYFKLLIELDKK